MDRKRIAMAQCFIETPDLLILDEPTNHLDHETVEWLEEYLARYTGSVLLVTHDRYFLDRVTNRIFELDNGKLYSYEGNYSTFLEAKHFVKSKNWHKNPNAKIYIVVNLLGFVVVQKPVLRNKRRVFSVLMS